MKPCEEAGRVLDAFEMEKKELGEELGQCLLKMREAGEKAFLGNGERGSLKDRIEAIQEEERELEDMILVEMLQLVILWKGA